MAGFDPKAYADAVEGQAKAGFDPAAYADAVEAASSTQQETPTIDGPATRLFHFARHIALGAGDKILAAEQALGDVSHDKTGKVGFADAYNRDLGFMDKTMEASDKAHPVEKWEGNIGGFLGSSLALGIPGLLSGGAAAQTLPRALALRQAAREGMKLGGIVGGVGGFGGDRSDSALGTAANTTLGSLLGIGAGGVAPYVADYAGRGAQWLGGKAQDLAGWFKVHSLHPNPTVAEAMAKIPGGKIGVGKELLEQGVGGITKEGTAEQASAAMNEAGNSINGVAQAHDAAGGAPVDLGSVFNDADAIAQKMQARPPTEDAGNKLAGWMAKYRKLYSGGPVKAEDALVLKRELADEAYKSGIAASSGDTVAGHFGEALAKVERGVDSQMDKTIGPGFEEANVTFRRMMEAKKAATRVAARTTSNHLLGLIPSVFGGGWAAAGHGGAESAAVALGSTLAQKYGSQAAARLLYSPLGGGFGLLGRGLQALPGAVSSGIAAEEASPFASGLMPQTLGDLLMGNRARGQPTYALKGQPP